MSSFKRNVNKFGANPDIGTATTPEDMWNGGGTYTGFSLGAPETIQIFSSDINDTLAGTGARTIRVFGLPSATSTDYISEDFNLTGTVPVVSTSTWYRINRSQILTAGTVGHNIGAITIRKSVTTADVFSVMPATFNQTAIAAFTIPFRRTGFLNAYNISFVRTSGAAGSGVVTIRAREPGEVFRVRAILNISTSSPLSDNISKYPIELPALTDVKITVESVSDNLSTVSGSFNVTYS